MNFEKVPVLPQFFYKFKAPEGIAGAMPSLARKLEYVEDKHNSISRDKMLHERDDFSEFATWVNDCLNHIKTEQGYECDSLEVSQVWINKTTKVNKIGTHTHTNSLVSAVYYIDDTNVSTVYYTDSIWAKAQGFLNVHIEDHAITRTMIRGKKGELLMFPSNLCHYVTPIEDEEVRYTLALNSWPRGMVGNPELLSAFRS